MAEEDDQSPPVALDGPWKESLERFFEPFMALFFPQAHAEIDWSRGYESLDGELQQIARDAELGQRLADKLIRVWRLGGDEAWVLIHVEVQGQPEPEFPERMYVYNYRCYDRFRKPVMSVAVLGDTQRSWRPDHFGYDLWGSQAGLRFVPVKLLLGSAVGGVGAPGEPVRTHRDGAPASGDDPPLRRNAFRVEAADRKSALQVRTEAGRCPGAIPVSRLDHGSPTCVGARFQRNRTYRAGGTWNVLRHKLGTVRDGERPERGPMQRTPSRS